MIIFCPTKNGNRKNKTMLSISLTISLSIILPGKNAIFKNNL